MCQVGADEVNQSGPADPKRKENYHYQEQTKMDRMTKTVKNNVLRQGGNHPKEP